MGLLFGTSICIGVTFLSNENEQGSTRRRSVLGIRSLCRPAVCRGRVQLPLLHGKWNGCWRHDWPAGASEGCNDRPAMGQVLVHDLCVLFGSFESCRCICDSNLRRSVAGGAVHRAYRYRCGCVLRACCPYRFRFRLDRCCIASFRSSLTPVGQIAFALSGIVAGRSARATQIPCRKTATRVGQPTLKRFPTSRRRLFWGTFRRCA
jgi:hypothetical protein